MTAPQPSGPVWFTGVQRAQLLSSLEQMQELATVAHRADVGAWAADWHLRIREAPTLDEASVDTYRGEVARCRACIEQASAGAPLSSTDRALVERLDDELQHAAVAPVPMPVRPTAWMNPNTVQAFWSELHQRQTTVQDAGLLVLPIVLTQITQVVEEAQDGRGARQHAVEEARARALERVESVLVEPTLSPVANTVIVHAASAMRAGEPSADATHAMAPRVGAAPVVSIPPVDVDWMIENVRYDLGGPDRSMIEVDAGRLRDLLVRLTTEQGLAMLTSAPVALAPVGVALG